jgi:transcription antitermination protein NusB
MARRSRAREVALQVLYEDDINPDRNMHTADTFVSRRLRNESALVEFAQSLISGVRRNRGELDDLLAQRAANWSLGRMAVIDRNIIRIGAFEILYAETPGRVAINEAIEIAKRYGGENSAHFVNGILDRIFRDQSEPPTER